MDKDSTLDDIKKEGIARGRAIASWVDMPEGRKTYFTESDGRVTVMSVAEAEIVMCDLASTSESTNRDYSPFEVTAHAINEREDSEEAWQQFDAGISEGINDNITERLSKYTDEDFANEK